MDTELGGIADLLQTHEAPDTPLQKRLGIRDTPELALSDWHSFAEFQESDAWPRRWAETYVEQSAAIYAWLRDLGMRFMPAVNVVANIAPAEHGSWLLGPISFFDPIANFFLAICQFFRDISFHSKCLLFSSGCFVGKQIIH